MTDASAAAAPALHDLADDPHVLDSLPGHLMMWVLIFSELAAFGALLAGFSVARALDPSGFAAGQSQLDPAMAAANTLFLVASGWLAANARGTARRGDRRGSRRWLAGAGALGALFIVVKLAEYAGEIGRGADIDGSTFFTLYFLLTGFHLLHVALGIVILAAVGWRADHVDVETGAAFWHMVDLIWLMMFPIVYLMR